MSIPRTLALILVLVSSLASCKGKTSDPSAVSDASSAPFASPASIAEAQHAAEAWLALVDGGQIAKSWTEAASYFKSTIDSPGWESAVAAVRTPLGAVKSRGLKSSVPTRSPPGAPDGEYVVLKFDTAFEHKAVAIETVTPMKDKDGQWRVSGYFIK